MSRKRGSTRRTSGASIGDVDGNRADDVDGNRAEPAAPTPARFPQAAERAAEPRTSSAGAGSSRLLGNEQTRFFHGLTPDRILAAVEAAGLECTGRCLALNSMENRVYDVEVEVDGDVKSPSERFRVAKFYRPGRWSREQILEEHRFLLELAADEIPVVPPLPLTKSGVRSSSSDDGKNGIRSRFREDDAKSGISSRFDDDDDGDGDDAGAHGGDTGTLGELPDLGIHYALFPRMGGRLSDEISEDDAEQLGRLLARVHNVGARASAPERLRLDVATYGRGNLDFLLESDTIPAPYRERYRYVVLQICDRAEPWFEHVPVQRIHGDCHLGNILWGREGAMLVDFDDMLRGPCVQDLWLIAVGRDEWAAARRRALIDGYEQIRDFDHSTLRLVEPLRALRLVHFAAWIARRWEDAAFPRVFTDFRSERYWVEQIEALQECAGALGE